MDNFNNEMLEIWNGMANAILMKAFPRCHSISFDGIGRHLRGEKYDEGAGVRMVERDGTIEANYHNLINSR